MTTPIQDYAIVGDGRSAALIFNAMGGSGAVRGTLIGLIHSAVVLLVVVLSHLAFGMVVGALYRFE